MPSSWPTRPIVSRPSWVPMTLPDPTNIEFYDPRPVPIVRATDLGSVQVLKHVDHFLLTDTFGDIHPDSRGLGLYRGDTRLLSCSVLRVGGERPVLLQTSVGGNYRGGIQMTNPSADRNPDAKVHPLDELVGRTIGIGRVRIIAAEGMSENLRVVNHAARPASIPVELELGSDGADIFEVRGYPRHGRGRLAPVAVADRRVTFRYAGLDGVQRLTHLVFNRSPIAVESIDPTSADGSDSGASVRLHWTLQLEAGQVRELDRTIWSTRPPVP